MESFHPKVQLSREKEFHEQEIMDGKMVSVESDSCNFVRVLLPVVTLVVK